MVKNMNEHMVSFENVDFIYKTSFTSGNEVKALSNINIDIEKGQYVAVIGRNGSGKSTMARLINALLTPVKGVVYINGMDTTMTTHLWEIRKTAGIVFQNPENQIVGTVIEEDVAFGPENLGIPPAEIQKRVDDALDKVGMAEYKNHASHLLSGGQKQKVAIAGILAMKPECIILDEATAMLDPVSRREIVSVIKSLNRNENITVIHITHHMDEAIMAKRVIVTDEGRIVLDGKPEEVFSNVDEIKKLGLDVPQITELFYELKKCGYNLPINVSDIDSAVGYIIKQINNK
jgi:energy-coupling factor transport system ATP-binding protein